MEELGFEKRLVSSLVTLETSNNITAADNAFFMLMAKSLKLTCIEAKNAKNAFATPSGKLDDFETFWKIVANDLRKTRIEESVTFTASTLKDKTTLKSFTATSLLKPCIWKQSAAMQTLTIVLL